MRGRTAAACAVCALVAAAGAVLHASGGYRAASHSLRYYGYEDFVEIKQEEIARWVAAPPGSRPGSDRRGPDLAEFWEATYGGSPLGRRYERALAEERRGNFARAAALFRATDALRVQPAAWSEPPPRVTRIFREAADRVALYAPPRVLLRPDLLRRYLDARAKYVEGDWHGAEPLFAALAEDAAGAGAGPLADQAALLALTCGLKARGDEEARRKFLAFAETSPTPRTLLTLATELAYPRSGTGEPGKERAIPLLERLLREHPRDRYADDAARLLAHVASDLGDWDLCARSFRTLAESRDDLVPKGEVLRLAASVAARFGKPSTSQALWELAGKPGSFEEEADDLWASLGPRYQPFLLFLRAGELRAERWPEAESLLQAVVSRHAAHPVAADAQFLLAGGPAGGTGRLEARLRERKDLDRASALYEQFVRRHPGHRSARAALRNQAAIIRTTGASPARLAAAVRDGARAYGADRRVMQDLAGLPGLEPLPFHDARLDEACLVAGRSWARLLQHFPDSPAAPLAYLSLSDRLTHERVREITGPAPASVAGGSAGPGEEARQIRGVLIAFGKRHLVRHPDGPLADGLRIKQARLELEQGRPKAALQLTDRYLRTGRRDYWHDEALWVRARSFEALGDRDAAQREFERLVLEFPRRPGDGVDRETYSWDGELLNPRSPRAVGSSPYTDFALGRMALKHEDDGRFDEALKIYLDLGYRIDIALLLDALMPDAALEAFLGKYPDHPSAGLVRRSLGVRRYREHRFDEALALLEGTGREEEVRAVRVLVERADQATDAEERARGRYALAKHFYEMPGRPYAHEELWKTIWQSWIADRNPQEHERYEEFRRRTNRYLVAAEEFKRFLRESPGHPLTDRALYSHALSRIKGGNHPNRLPWTADAEAIADLERIGRDFPESPLADDALLWAFFFTGEERYYTELLRVGAHGDVLSLLRPEEILGLKGRGRREPMPGMSRYRDHNARLYGTELDAAPAVTLSSAVMPPSITGGRYSGWLYYRLHGAGVFEGVLDLGVGGLGDGTLRVNFGGAVVERRGGAQETVRVARPGWAGGTSQWVHIEVEGAPAQGFTLAASLLATREDLRLAVPVARYEIAGRAPVLRQESGALIPLGASYGGFLRGEGGNAYALFHSAAGTTQVFSFSGDDARLRSEEVPGIFRVLLPLRGGAVLLLADRALEVTNNRPVAALLWDGDRPPLVLHPTGAVGGWEALSFRGGDAVLAGRDERIALLPHSFALQESSRPVDLLPAPSGGQGSARTLEAAASCGYARNAIELPAHLPAFSKATCVGTDAGGRLYLLLDGIHLVVLRQDGSLRGDQPLPVRSPRVSRSAWPRHFHVSREGVLSAWIHDPGAQPSLSIETFRFEDPAEP